MTDARIPIQDEVARRGLKLRRSGQELIGPCPACGGTDRFSINTRNQVSNCRGFGGGDVIALVQHLDGCDFKAAVRTLGIEERPSPAVRPALPAAPERPREDANGARALAIWHAAVPIAGT